MSLNTHSFCFQNIVNFKKYLPRCYKGLAYLHANYQEHKRHSQKEGIKCKQVVKTVATAEKINNVFLMGSLHKEFGSLSRLNKGILLSMFNLLKHP